MEIKIEMRIVAARARQDLGQVDAAIITLTSRELKTENGDWPIQLRYAYTDELYAAGRLVEAKERFDKTALVDVEDSTDAAEGAGLLILTFYILIWSHFHR